MIENTMALWHWLGRYGDDLDLPALGIVTNQPKPSPTPAAVKLETPKGVFNRLPVAKTPLLVIDNHKFEACSGDDLTVDDVFSVKGQPGTYTVTFRAGPIIATSQGRTFKVSDIPNVLRKKKVTPLSDCLVLAITGEKPVRQIVDYRPYIAPPNATNEERAVIRRKIFQAIQDGILTADEANNIFDQHTLSVFQSEPEPKGIEQCLA